MSDDKKRYRVLLVEDDPYITEIYNTKFTGKGFDIAIAKDGLEVADMFTEFRPDIVLLDIMLPGMDGWEVLKKIKSTEAGKKTLVVMLTNVGEKEKIQQAYDMGADEYFVKAFLTPEEVADKALELLKKHDKNKNE